MAEKGQHFQEIERSKEDFADVGSQFPSLLLTYDAPPCIGPMSTMQDQIAEASTPAPAQHHHAVLVVDRVAISASTSRGSVESDISSFELVERDAMGAVNVEVCWTAQVSLSRDGVSHAHSELINLQESMIEGQREDYTQSHSAVEHDHQDMAEAVTPAAQYQAKDDTSYSSH